MDNAGDDIEFLDQLTELQAERDYIEEYVADRKPYWMNLRHPRDGELQWELNNYAPLAHYDLAIQELLDGHHEKEDARTDGGYGDMHKGGRKSAVYYWVDPTTDAVLSPAEVNGEPAPFYPDIGAAERDLEHRAHMNDVEDYSRFSLYKASTRKVKDAVDVLTVQEGIDSFLEPDG